MYLRSLAIAAAFAASLISMSLATAPGMAASLAAASAQPTQFAAIQTAGRNRIAI